jgi:hypothetical protein
MMPTILQLISDFPLNQDLTLNRCTSIPATHRFYMKNHFYDKQQKHCCRVFV